MSRKSKIDAVKKGDLLIPESGLDLEFEKVVPLDKEHFPDDAFRKQMENYDGTDRVDREK